MGKEIKSEKRLEPSFTVTETKGRTGITINHDSSLFFRFCINTKTAEKTACYAKFKLENNTQSKMKNSQEVPVSVLYGEDDNPVGILVQTFDDSFIIDLHDVENGREMTWKEAMEKYEDILPDKQRALFICAYLETINKLLKEVGGDQIKKWYWTKTEYTANGVWFYYGYLGCVTSSKYTIFSVRPVLASA